MTRRPCNRPKQCHFCFVQGVRNLALLLGCEFSASIKGWGPPHDAEALDDEDRKWITSNIRQAFAPGL
jgi:hypothetical protein